MTEQLFIIYLKRNIIRKIFLVFSRLFKKCFKNISTTLYISVMKGLALIIGAGGIGNQLAADLSYSDII